MYKLVNNEQLEVSQKSELGVDLGYVVASKGGVVKQVLCAAGLADDVGLLTQGMKDLQALLELTKIYCEKYQVKLVASCTAICSYFVFLFGCSASLT